jgi:EAL domain-containing protein (putative c-di-GMP-specific phosphodiesterase class I)
VEDGERTFRPDAASTHMECGAGDGLFIVNAAGDRAPVDLRALSRTSKSLPLNQRFARMWEISDATLERFKLEQELRSGIEHNEFELHMQPQADLHSGQILGAEALVRWRHGERGLVMPDDFIPVAEESDLIVQLGAHVLRMACEQAMSRERRGLPPVRVAVNLSAVQFVAPGLAGMVSNTLDETHLDPRLLELEITESAAMGDAARAVKVMSDLAELGVTLSLDDFGTGYSSLRYLNEFPIHALKVDKSFVQGVTFDANSAAIVAAVVALAHTLRLKVVAEGVETAAQLRSVRERGCDLYQGMLLGRPMPSESFDWMLSQQAAA